MTTTAIRSIISYGTDGLPVDIECHLSNSLPNIVIVGFASKTVGESKERIRGAFANSGLTIPRKRISINLAPADVPKDSSSLDLPIAMAIMAAGLHLTHSSGIHEAYIGELGLDGTIRPVRGIIGKLISGRRHGISRFYIPAANLQQALAVPNVELIPLERIRQLYEHFNGTAILDPIHTGDGHHRETTAPLRTDTSLRDIIGQRHAKRALQIAAAGGHNLLLNGPPGTGKSMLAKALPELLPPLSHEEMLEVTHLHSLAGRDFEHLITDRPFRAPHHSASHVAIVGGGVMVKPGEISLAHRGVLFFDEAPEFARPTIEALRQPLEERTISVARARESCRFPANFIFVATANPCPCGYFGAPLGRRNVGTCSCTPSAITSYRRKISGPILDRIDMCVTVEPIDHSQLLTEQSDSYDLASTIKLVLLARKLQFERFGTRAALNSAMSNEEIKHYCQPTDEAKRLLDQAAQHMDLSARGYMRCLKVARTIADLDQAAYIGEQHITEALRYRNQSHLSGQV